MPSRYPILWLSLPLLLLIPQRGSAQEKTPSGDLEKIEPADVMVQVTLLRQELSRIGAEMGKPEYQEVEIVEIQDAAPREVYFQAVTLLRKSNQLCFEHVRAPSEIPPTPRSPLRPHHVRALVLDALKKIRTLKGSLKIPEVSVAPKRNPDHEPTDVLRSILHANRHLNQLLDKPFTPSDAYEQVTLALKYATRLKARFPNVRRIPPIPVRERKKKPREVCQRLVECCYIVQAIGKRSGRDMLKLTLRKKNLPEVTPSDVYDVASILVAELAWLYQGTSEATPPPKTFYPGRKVPADVFQRAGLLQAQLQELDRLVKDPSWLGQKKD